MPETLPIYYLDPSRLKLREIEEFEKRTGRKFRDVLSEGLDGKDWTVFAHLAMKRENPSATLADAGELEISQVVFGGAPEVDAKTAKKTSTKTNNS